jgi:cysteine desulfurase/selenocysteine lyase
MIVGATIPSALNLAALRSEFPILSSRVHGGKPLVYLDNAATTQKPSVVIDVITDFYRHHNANVHRAGHILGAEVTSMFENARRVVAESIGAAAEEIVFTRGTTESLNLLASTLTERFAKLNPRRSVVITEMEHHANIVPWQMLRERTGAELRVIPILDDGSLDMVKAEQLIDDSTGVVSVVHVSNTLGTTNDVKRLAQLARGVGAVSIVDAAQSVSSSFVDVEDIGCDALVFSGHKVYGPMGIGVAYIRRELLDTLPPYQGGGSMITSVSFDKTTYADGPLRFEAGTPNIEGAIGLGTALEWRNALDMQAVVAHKQDITDRLVAGLRRRDGVHVHGHYQGHSGIVSFSLGGVHPQDLGLLLDAHGVAVRTGHHCTMPLTQRYSSNGSVRVSAAVYSSADDVEMFFSALDRACAVLQ